MIFLLMTLLGWAILSMGMLGIEWGYATLSHGRLQTAAQSLVLDSPSEQQRFRLEEAVVLETMGLNSSAVVQRSFPHPSRARVDVRRSAALPLNPLLINRHISGKTSFMESIIDSMKEERSVKEQKGKWSRHMKSSAVMELRPARQVGLAGHEKFPMLGAIPCVLKRTFWKSLEKHHALVATINANGEIFAQGLKIGQFNRILTHIGQKIDDPKPFNHLTVQLDGYAPIFQRFGIYDRVVGFGHIQVKGALPQVAITMQTTKVRSHNASIQLTGDISQLSKEELNQIFAINHTLEGAVLAPTLML